MKKDEEVPDAAPVRLADVINIQLIQRLQDDFAKGVGVASVTVDLDGNPITRPSSYTRFCMDYTHTTERGDKRCADSHRKGGEMAARLGKPVIYECHAGLIDFAAPILLEGRQIGTILGGQVLVDIPNEKKIRQIAREIGVGEDGYFQAVQEVRRTSRDCVEAAANILYLVANNMSQVKYKQQKLVLGSALLQKGLNDIVVAVEQVAASAAMKHLTLAPLDQNKEGTGAFIEKINEAIGAIRKIAAMIDAQQAEIARLESLNIIGDMAVNIGHEVRNPLTTVRGFLQLFSRKPEFSKHRGILTLMITEIDQANGIISRFLALANNRKLNLKISDLNQIITQMMPSLQRAGAVNRVEIKPELGRISPLLLDEEEIGQLISNVVKNAIEAAEPGQFITIRTIERIGKTILSVSDNGRGMTKDILEKVGTPFFSTKPNGAGLGVAISYKIATRHSAKMEIKSDINVGTNVEVIFDSSVR